MPLATGLPKGKTPLNGSNEGRTSALTFCSNEKREREREGASIKRCHCVGGWHKKKLSKKQIRLGAGAGVAAQKGRLEPE